jgi:hypothetical protein
MSDDPFFIVKKEVEEALESLLEIFKKELPTTGTLAHSNLQDQIHNITADLEELEDTIKVIYIN